MTQVLIDRAMLEQLVVALNIVLDCRPIGYETMTEMRESTIRAALGAGRAALANAEPKPKMLSDILKDTP